MNTVQFQSDTYNKLLKIKDGKVFAESTTFIKEFIQNCQRSKSTKIDFEFWEKDGIGYLSCVDNGCGCKNPQDLFTLDYSNWKSTNEGFGIGFWSCLAIPNLYSVDVRSNKWDVFVDTNNLFKKKNDSLVTTFDNDFIDGFRVVLVSEWLYYNQEKVLKTIEEVGKNIDIEIYINGNRIYQIDVISEFRNKCISNNISYYEYHNSFYDAIFSFSKNSYGDLSLYYEDRYVRSLYEFDYVNGVIMPHNGKIDLIEPDRERYVLNEKWYKLKEKINKNIKDTYKKHVTINGINDKDLYDGIARYLEPREFKKYLSLSFLEDDFIVEEDTLFIDEKEDDNEIRNNIINMNGDDNVLSTSIEMSNNAISQPISRNLFIENDQEINTFVGNNHYQESDMDVPEKNDFQNKKNLLSKSVWVHASEMEEYKNQVAKARYCGIPVIIVDNILQEKALEDSNIPCVSNLDDVLSETIIKTNICLKNANEVAFIELLKPICERFSLEYDTFHIANLETRREFTHNGKIVMKQCEKNTKNKIVTYGLCDGRHIYLDRNALKLNSFKLKNCSKATKYAVLLKTSRTIAHELAHYLYDTVDNTILHYKREQQIWQEIVNLYVA